MSFLSGRIADQPGITLKGYSGIDFSDFVQLGENLYAEAPNDNLIENIKSKYTLKIDLLNDELKGVNLEMVLKTSPSVKIELEAKKQDLTEKIIELKRKMFEEFEDKGIEYCDENFLERRIGSNTRFSGQKEIINREYQKYGDFGLLKKNKIPKKPVPMELQEFCERYYSKNRDLAKSIYNVVKDDLDKQLKVIDDSKKVELQHSIYTKKPEEITEQELKNYLERNWLKSHEFPVKNLNWLIYYKYPSAFTTDFETFKTNIPESSVFQKVEEKNWGYYIPLLRKYYYSYPSNINGPLFKIEQDELQKGLNMEYTLRDEYMKEYNLGSEYNIAVKWYLLDNPEDLSFEEYYTIFCKTEDYLPQDFYIAKDYLFQGITTSFKEYKKNWEYHPFEYRLPQSSESSESSISESIDSIYATETDNLKKILENVYHTITKPDFMWGMITGFIIEKIF